MVFNELMLEALQHLSAYDLVVVEMGVEDGLGIRVKDREGNELVVEYSYYHCKLYVGTPEDATVPLSTLEKLLPVLKELEQRLAEVSRRARVSTRGGNFTWT